jgi:triosephosphate isomerase
MRPLLVAGNWKMNGDLAFVADITKRLKELFNDGVKTTCLLCPPAVYLPQVAGSIQGSPIKLGAQNMHQAIKGAFTGELSSKMIKEVGVNYVILGHSERRTLFGETDTLVFEKLKSAVEAGLVPILCVGETLSEREAGKTKEVIASQLDKVLAEVDLLSNAVVAYEPVWAIGTGKTATPEEAQSLHAFIRAKVAEKDEKIAQKLPLLYGGSVNSKNAKDLFSQADIDGGLVGGASLNVDEFVEIVTCTNYS